MQTEYPIITCAEDLKKDFADRQKVQYVCQNCGKTRVQYFFSLKQKPESLLFCPRCNCALKGKETFLKRYGVTNPSKNSQVKQKRKITCLKKYGVENTLMSSSIREKAKQTCIDRYGRSDVGQFGTKEHTEAILARYGVENPQQNIQIREKTKQTCLEKYNVETPLQSPELREKGKETSLKHFGTEFPQQSKIIREKTKQTNLKRYGAANPFQSVEIREKIKENSLKENNTPYPGWSQRAKLKREITSLKKYKKRTFFGSTSFREKVKQTFLEKYGVEYYSQSEEARKHRRNQYRIKDQYFDSKLEVCFYIYCKDQNLNIQKCTKKFEYVFKNKTHFYFPDFEINDKLYEIKGNQFLKEDNTWQNPYDHNQDKLYEAKHQCAVKNNVIILYSRDCQKYLDYVEEKYGKNYLQQLKVAKD